MDFEKIKHDCPWRKDPRRELTICLAIDKDCADYNCAPFYWIQKLEDKDE